MLHDSASVGGGGGGGGSRGGAPPLRLVALQKCSYDGYHAAWVCYVIC